MKIENLPDLELNDDGFAYKGRSCPYKWIDAITFQAVHTKHYTNFAHTGNSYDSNLILHLSDGETLKIKQPWAYWGSKQKTGMEAIWNAKEILSEITFEHRVKKFEEELKRKNYFSYGRYQFRSGGDVFKDGDYLFNVKNGGVTVSLSPFQLRLGKKKSVGQRILSALVNLDEIVDISRDRDCFLYMYRAATGQFWKNEHYRRRSDTS